MIGLLFHFEDTTRNVYSGSDGSLQLWRETIKSLGCSWFGMVDLTAQAHGADYAHNDEEIDFARYTSLAAAVAANPGTQFVYLETLGALQAVGATDVTELEDFTHPAAPVIYVVGPDSGGITLEQDDARKFVHVAGVGSLWAITAATLILYSRKQQG